METDWKKKYEEALSKARAEYENARKQGYTWLMGLLEGMFPDLKESEDERIRKWIIEEFKLHYDFESKSLNPMVEKALAWLEKQKEQTEDLSTRLNGVMQEYVKEGKDEEEQEHRLKCYQLFWDALGDSEFFKQKEQKPAEWSEEDKKRIKQLIYDTEFIKAHYEKRKEELGKQFNNILIEDCDEQISWLKSLHPQPKQEWSEEDKYILKNIHDFVKENTINPNRVNCAKECLNWLNSLPERFNLQ